MKLPGKQFYQKTLNKPQTVLSESAPISEEVDDHVYTALTEDCYILHFIIDHISEELNNPMAKLGKSSRFNAQP